METHFKVIRMQRNDTCKAGAQDRQLFTTAQQWLQIGILADLLFLLRFAWICYSAQICYSCNSCQVVKHKGGWFVDQRQNHLQIFLKIENISGL